jgi:hypothetical protein
MKTDRLTKVFGLLLFPLAALALAEEPAQEPAADSKNKAHVASCVQYHGNQDGRTIMGR